MLNTFGDIGNEPVGFFQRLIRVADGAVSGDVLSLGDLLPNKLSKDDRLVLVEPVSNLEIKMVMFSTADNKSPCPDGYSSHFFKATLSVVGHDVCLAVCSHFDRPGMLRELNYTILTLVLKVQSPQSMSMNDFHPIACCNTVYKCIIKILAIRMRPK